MMQQINPTVLHEPSEEERKFLGIMKAHERIIKKRGQEVATAIKKRLQSIDQMICVMKGGLHWANLLERHIKPNERFNANISLYDVRVGKPFSDGVLEHIDYKKKNVLIIEDLIITGSTMDFVIRTIIRRNPKEIIVSSLIDKSTMRISKNFWLNQFQQYNAFQSNENEFLVGYGMTWPSWPEPLRGLKHVYRAKNPPIDYEAKMGYPYGTIRS